MVRIRLEVYAGQTHIEKYAWSYISPACRVAVGGNVASVVVFAAKGLALRGGLMGARGAGMARDPASSLTRLTTASCCFAPPFVAHKSARTQKNI
jgi:hypothetical protein